MPEQGSSLSISPVDVPWWRLFLFLSPWYGAGNIAHRPSPTITAHVLPGFLLAASVFLSSFMIFSNERYLDHELEKAIQRATTREQLEVLELNRSANKQILQNPGIRLLIAGKVSLRYITSWVITLIVCWLPMAAISGRLRGFPDFWLVTMSTTNILLVGVGCQFLLRWFLVMTEGGVSLTLFAPSLDHSSIVQLVLAQLDFFNIVFLYLAASRLRSFFHEHTMTLLVIVLSMVVILILFSSLTGIDFLLIS